MALFTGIVTALSSAAKTAELIAERAERGELLDLGAARLNAEKLNDLHQKLLALNAAADRLDIDPEFARVVRDHFEDDG